MKLQPFEQAWLPELMRWFPDSDSCLAWGGPGFRFPYTESTFREDAKLESLPTWALVDDDGAFAGFGQYYLRVGRCHLGRLVVAPNMRGRGFGSVLIHGLCKKGSAELGVDTYSLFVLPGNESALRLYKRLGFSEAEYPEKLPGTVEDIYMVASHLN